MKIALITDAWHPQINGVVRTLDHVRIELESLGHIVEVIDPQQFRTMQCPRYPEIRLSLLPGRGVRRRLDDMSPNAVHIATEGPLGLAARRYCIRRDLPFTTSYHTQFPLYLKRYFGLPATLTYSLVRWFHKPAIRTLVPTPSIRDELVRKRMRNIVVWTRGVDAELFQPRSKEFIRDSRPISLYAGRVAFEKNLDAFLSADVPGTKYIVGDGPALSTLIARYPHARFVGFKHGVELAQFVSAADVFVFPSKTDTFGLVMLEAMACGVPVAAFPVTGPVDVVRDGVTGALDHDLGKAIKAASKLDGQACRAHALQFSWRRCAEMFLQNLQPITAKQPTSLRSGQGSPEPHRLGGS